MPQVNLSEAIRGIENYANEHYDGHYTIMKFTNGYKVIFGTLDMTDTDRDYISYLPTHESIVTAVVNAVLMDTATRK